MRNKVVPIRPADVDDAADRLAQVMREYLELERELNCRTKLGDAIRSRGRANDQGVA
jgi:hypothetical protein